MSDKYPIPFCPESVEIWAMEVDSAKHTSTLTEKQSEFLIMCLMNREALNKSIPEKIKNSKKTEFPLEKMMFNRLESVQVKIEPSAALLCVTMIETPGEITMLAAYLLYKQKDLNIAEFTVNNLCELFPDGYINSQSWSNFWKLQKCDKRGSDNLLDYKECYQSLWDKK